MKIRDKLLFRCFFFIILSFLMICAPIQSDFALNSDSSPPNEVFSVEVISSVHSVLGIHKSISPHKLLPDPRLQVLFIVVPLMLLLRITLFLRKLHPFILLLLKQQFLLPIKFISIFVGTTSK